MLPERDELTGQPVLYCLNCGERLWSGSVDAAAPPRTERHTRHGQQAAAGRHLLFDPAQVAAIEAALAAGVSIDRVARRFGCAYETIRRIRAGEYQ